MAEAQELQVAQAEQAAQVAPEMDITRWLQGKDAVLVPKSYERYCSAQVEDGLRHFQGELIECSYELDEGSFMYLHEKTKRILQKK